MFTDMTPGERKKTGQSSQEFTYHPKNLNICPQTKVRNILDKNKAGEKIHQSTDSTIAIGVSAGAGGLAILSLTVFLVFRILKKRSRIAPSGGRKTIDENPLYHTYYAGDERLNDTAEVNMSGKVALNDHRRLSISILPQVYDRNVAYYGMD